jgi:outer membrane protein assembly factor BamB
LAVRPGSQESDQQPQIAYELNRNVPLVPTPVVKDGRLYLWSDDGIVSCFKVANGEMVWRERAGGFFYGSPVCVNNRLYCISRSGEVVVIAASDKFEVLGRVSLGEPSFATPAIAGGVMYLRTRTQLFSLGGKRAIIR